MSPSRSNIDSLAESLLHTSTTAWHRGGWIGVDLFFVLSGFLVSGLLFREHQKYGAISGKRFLVRRGLKIYPAFWVLIFVTVCVTLFTGGEIRPSQVVHELLFIQNYSEGLWGHTWSLAVEEHFYLFLLLLLLVLACGRKVVNPFTSVPVIFIVMAVVSLLMRVLTARLLPFTHRTNLFPSHLRMDSLFFGVLISYCFHYHTEAFTRWARRYRAIMLPLGVLLLLPPFVYESESTPLIYTVGLTGLYLGSGMILITATTLLPPRNAAAVALARLGADSYSIYLWHIPVAYWVVPWAKRVFEGYWHWPMYFILQVFGSLFVGVVMARLVEYPVIRLRDRWFPSRGRPLDAPKT